MRGGRHRSLGYWVTELADGRSRFDWTPPAEIANPAGMVHGGFVAALVDDVCGTAVQSMLDGFRAYPTASMHVDFLRGVRVGLTHVARGVVVRAGRRLTVADCTIHDPDGVLLARGTCSFALDLSDSPLVGFSALPPPD
jgi:uncharacterized protein (TIGR00369 family)